MAGLRRRGAAFRHGLIIGNTFRERKLFSQKFQEKRNCRAGACWPSLGQAPELIRPLGLPWAGLRLQGSPGGHTIGALGCFPEVLWSRRCLPCGSPCLISVPLGGAGGEAGQLLNGPARCAQMPSWLGLWWRRLPPPRFSCPLSILVGTAAAPGASGQAPRTAGSLLQRGSCWYMAFSC